MNERRDGGLSPRRTLWLLVLATLVAWLPCLSLGFSFDDREILESPCVRGELPATCALDRDYWHHRGDAGHWRPSAVGLLRLDWALYGEHPLGFHLTNVLLHAAVVLLAALMWRAVGFGAGGAAGLLVFAVHPALADSVAWVSGRTSMACALGGLVGAWLLVRALRAGSRAGAAAAAGAGLLLALAGKEEGLAFVPLYLWLAHREAPRLLRWTALGVAAGAAAWLAARAHALGAALPSAPHSVLADAPLTERLGVGGRAAVEGLRHALLPLAFRPSVDAREWLTHRFQPLALVGWLAWLAGLLPALVALLRRAPVSAVRASAFLAAAAFTPFLQVVPAGEVFGPRFLYLPLLFAAPLFSALYARLPARLRAPVGALVLVALVALAWQHARVYESRASYREHLLAARPDDARSWNDLGIAREEAGDLDGAVDAWRRAAELAPEYSRPWTNLGRAHQARAEDALALEAYREAVRRGPRNAIAHCNLASFLLARGEDADLREARALYERATTLTPGLAAAWRGVGNACLRLGDADGARSALEQALQLAPGDARSRALLDRVDPP